MTDPTHLTIAKTKLLELLEWPLGDDGLMPRMHSKAKAEWYGKIMELGDLYAATMQREAKLRKALEQIAENPQRTMNQAQGGGLGNAAPMNKQQIAREALKEIPSE